MGPRRPRNRRAVRAAPGWNEGNVTVQGGYRKKKEEIMNPTLVVTEATTTDDVAAAGFPDPLYCKRGLVDHARLLADRIDAERGGDMDCGGGGMGYVPDVVEIGE